ncbi:hypothetical protein SAMN05421664_2721 [Chryseobacterium soldanellicola]|uniref:Uncharacterized protein n=1 Tax=Chryseobacterium soldanellicola TaxID=311333 RepID=A0A1H1E0B0_9FLAO|nr:hypothetical protein [Chryseobacterium soldanellicola]SDQ81919.1 hypothetical protein SAMN05421664_2721 [Chryseobacterium soldanellicola]
MIYMLFAPFHDHKIDKITQYVREVFFKQFPDESKRVWLGLIKYSNYKKANPINFGYQSEDELNEAEGIEAKFVQEISSDKVLKLNLTEISLEQNEGYLLARAFVITPYDTADKDFESFINHVLPIVLDDLTKEKITHITEAEIHTNFITNQYLILNNILLIKRKQSKQIAFEYEPTVIGYLWESDSKVIPTISSTIPTTI